jgi:predicted Rossmann fold nucleotide-binding protein DprA/Smf involved in DNA uptake
VPDGGATGAPSTLEERVLAALDDRGLTVDDLTHRLALPVETTLAVLTTLEVHGDVERLSGMRFRRAA